VKKIKNFSRFYALYAKAAGADKEDLVRQFTDGRTGSLREMTPAEYNEMCNRLQGNGHTDGMALSRARGETLRAFSEIGITNVGNDYSEINRFCLQRSGFKKVFYDFTVEDLKALRRQIEAIKLKGRAKPKPKRHRALMLVPSTPIYA
jgi:hypothetical protein